MQLNMRENLAPYYKLIWRRLPGKESAWTIKEFYEICLISSASRRTAQRHLVGNDHDHFAVVVISLFLE